MSGPIPLRLYVTSGMVDLETVNVLVGWGEPMVSDTREFGDTFPYRAWMRLRKGGRAFGAPAPTVRIAAENLLAKVRG